MQTTTRARLRERLTQRLVPLLLDAGYRGPTGITGNTLLHEYRRDVDGTTQVLSIQLEKRGLPRYLVNLHIAPATGVDTLIREGGRILMGRLQPRRGPLTRSWFRADPGLIRRVLRSTPKTLEFEAVEECVRLLTEVEEWWTTQKPSEHITCVPIKYPGTQHGAAES